MTDLIKVAAFASLLEAEQIQSVLASQGVSAYVEGGAIDPSLVHVSSIRGGIRLVVPAAEVETARSVLAELNSMPETQAWYCGACCVDVDAGFVVCWSCGKHQNAVGEDRPEPAQTVETFDRNQPTRDLDPTNPYAVSSVASDTRFEEHQTDHEVEAMLERAYKAALIGLVSLFFLNAYSMYLLIKASVHTPHFTAKGKKRFYLSIMINIVSAILMVIMLRFANM